MVGIRIRPAVLGDERALAALNAFVQDFHVANHPSHFKPASLDEVAAWFRSLIERDTAQIWIADEDGTPVGYICMILRQRPDNPFSVARRWMEIDQVSVRPDRQRSGIGRRLVEQVFAAAKEAGITEVELTSWCFNAGAHEAFRRFGFAAALVRFGCKVSDEHQTTEKGARDQAGEPVDQPTPPS